jgi:hypothetical protein
VDDQPDSRIKNIAERDRRQKHGDDEEERVRRLALKREAAGPHGAETVRMLEALRNYLNLGAERIAELEGQKDEERKFLRQARGRRGRVGRAVKGYWQDRTLSNSRLLSYSRSAEGQSRSMRIGARWRATRSMMPKPRLRASITSAAIFFRPS